VKNDGFTIRAVGDICLTGVESDPFEHVAGALEADLVFGNLECCFSTRGVAATGKVVFNADPAAVRWLDRFDVLCLANNHTLDYGPDGLKDTLEVLEGAGRDYAGAGRNEREATDTRWLDVGDTRVAVVSTADASGGDASRPTVSVLSVDAVADRIRDARTRADVVIASYHGGIELDPLPTPFIVRSLRGFIDAGADVVLAHHPHVIQPVERYRGGVIVYSLGNFVFDNRRYGEYAGLASTTTILEVTLSAGEEPSYRYMPARIGEDFKPRLLDGAEADTFHDYMDGLERRLADVDPGAVDMERLANMTRGVHNKSFATLARYAVRHFRDFTFKELVVGGMMVLRSLFRRGGRPQ
jgi:poly-gamma-glutamate synthesis protein (capsule biosynthesis protein)